MAKKNLKIQLPMIIKDLGIDVPVMSTRVVGDRVELHLYGGKVVKAPASKYRLSNAWTERSECDPTIEQQSSQAIDEFLEELEKPEYQPPLAKDLEDFTFNELREMAVKLGIKVRGLKKADLIVAIKGSAK